MRATKSLIHRCCLSIYILLADLCDISTISSAQQTDSLHRERARVHSRMDFGSLSGRSGKTRDGSIKRKVCKQIVAPDFARGS